MTIRIQPYAGQHKEGVKNLVLPIQQEEFGIPITYEDQPDLQDIEAAYRTGSGDFWVALKGEEVVGSIALIGIGNRQAALRKMFVKPANHGKEAGVATRLLETLLAHAKQAGIAEIYLGTTSSFLAAHRFYEKMGFALLDETDLSAAFPKMAVDTRFYLFRTD